MTWIVSTVLQIAQRKVEAEERQFHAFHKIVERVVSPERNEGLVYIDRQAAVVFELRHFPRCYGFTERMLLRLKRKWLADPGPHAEVLIEETDLTLKHIQQNK